jgi:phosphoribosyl 1,2-cyclic phosphodiesterase
VCRQARDSGNSTYKRKNSCAVISTSSGSRILIDTPPQFPSQLEACSIDDRDIGVILLSHKHDDHILGMFHLMSSKTSKGAVIEVPVDIYAGPETKKHLFNRYSLLANSEGTEALQDVFHIIDMFEQREFFIGDCRIVPLETNHLKMKSPDPLTCCDETLGFAFSEAGKNFYYLIDAAETLPDKTILFMTKNRPDTIVIDCTYSDESAFSGHGDIESVINVRNLFPEARFVISHIGHKNHAPDRLEKILEPYDIEIGYDGMNIVI